MSGRRPTAGEGRTSAGSRRTAAQSRRTILQGGRRKAYRPLPAAERALAVAAALDAWERGDWFETHERLEPAWMGTDDLAERLVHQGVIKLAAAFVHLARGNRAGVRTNLAGALARLGDAIEAGADVAALASAVDALAGAVADAAVPLGSLGAPDLRALLPSGDLRAEQAG